MTSSLTRFIASTTGWASTIPAHLPCWALIRTIHVWTFRLLLASLLGLATFVLIATCMLDWQFKTVMSGSMSPVLEPGTVIVSKPVKPDMVQVGDIVSFHSDSYGVPVVHRVMAVRDALLETKGDANETADPGLVSPDELAGVVICQVPYVGGIAQKAGSPLGMAVLLMFPAAALTTKACAGTTSRQRRKHYRPPKNDVWSTGLEPQHWICGIDDRSLSTDAPTPEQSNTD